MEIKCLKVLNMTESLCTSNIRVKYMLADEIANIDYPKKRIVKESDLTKKSENRKKIICPIFYDCGGCDLLHVSYDYQLVMKKEAVEKIFIQENIYTTVLPVIENEKPLYYRHKVVLSATTINSKLRLGLYREHTKEVIPYLLCHIQDQEINDLLSDVEKVLNAFKITAYDINLGKGILKHVLVRKSYVNQDLMVVFVTNGNLFPNHKLMINQLLDHHKHIKTVIQNIHDKKTRLVLLDQEKVLYGKGYIEDEIEGLKFRLSPKSFYQVNPMQMIHLYEKALEFAQIKKDQIVLDTYSGVGTLALLASQYAKKVIAIEINKDAHQDAVYNKRNNSIENVEFICDDVERRMLSIDEKIDCLIMDPTRDGATESFLHTVLKVKPKKIVYISCDPRTQVRDIKILLSQYDIRKVQPVDMFSQTVHVENIVLLALK